MEALLGILLFAFGIVLSIALHEVGHLLPAKRFGVTVTQYMIGFGRTIWSTRKGGTEYGLKAVPLGGYIRMIGMIPPSRSGAPAVAGTTAPWRAMIDDSRAQSEAEMAGHDPARAFYLLPAGKKIVIMLGGPTMNLLLAVFFTAVALSGIGVPTPTSTVASVPTCVIPADATTADGQPRTDCLPGDAPSPAVAAGVQPGDTVVAVGGVPVSTWDETSAAIRAEGPGPATLTVERDGTQVTLTANLLGVSRTQDDGTVVEVGYLGVRPTSELVRQPLSEVPGVVADYVVRAGQAVIGIPARIPDLIGSIFGGTRDPEGPVGVVGATRLGGEVLALDEPLAVRLLFFINLLAGLNMSLFLFNLLPILPLDGGHVAGALIEGTRRTWARMRGKPDPGWFDVARLLPIAYVAAVVFVALAAVVFIADVVNPVSLTR